MSRKGKEFELFIKKIEALVLQEGGTIDSPAYIKDKITGGNREVDVAIRMKVGSTPILILIECRDRDAIEDVTWIEQLHTKVSDLNANKVIAVSSSGFSENARKKAEHHGIETRSVNDLQFDDIKDWFQSDHIKCYRNVYDIKDIAVHIDNIELVKEGLPGIRLTDEMIYSTKNGGPFSLHTIFVALLDQHGIWKKVPEDNNIHETPLGFIFDDPDDYYYIKHENRNLKIRELHFIVDLKIEITEKPISRIISYEGQEGMIAQTIEVPLFSDTHLMQLIKTQDGSVHLSARTTDNNEAE